jgi:hypothetical protein
MEVARSLDPRRVEIEFVAQRVAEEILAAAFEILTQERRPIPAADRRGQDEQDRDCSEIPSSQGVMP